MAHCFDDENPRHDRMIRKMPTKEGFVDRDVLDSHDPLARLEIHDPVHQKHGIPMRKVSHDAPNIDSTRIGSPLRLAPNGLGQLHVPGVTRSLGDDVPTRAGAQQRQVSHDVSDLVT